MNGDNGELAARVRDLEARLAALEARLGGDQGAGLPEAVPFAEAIPGREEMLPLPAKAAILRDMHGGPPPLPAEALAPASETAAPTLAPAPLPRPLPMPWSTPVPPAPPASLPYATPAPKARAIKEGTLEQTIGLKWAGWIGALVVVIGAGLGIKYAYDQNWFGKLPPALRLMVMSLVGFGLLAAGEWVYRRINRISAAGLFSAGVAMLFVVAYAGYGFFEPQVYGRDVAFIMMAVVTLIGAAVAIRGNLVSIGALSILGANLAPIVLSTHEPRPVPLMAYLLALQVVALALTWWGEGGKWWILRSLSLVSTSLWMLLLIGHPATQAQSAVAFVLIYAALYQAELLLSTLRWGRPAANTAPDGKPIFSTTVTALLTVSLLCLLREPYTAATRGLWTVGLAAATAGAALAVRRQEIFRPLAVGFWIQSAALAVLAVPVSFGGATVSLAWGAMALAFALLGAKLELRLARYAAAATWVLAAVWIGVWLNEESARAAAMRAWVSVGSFELVRWVAVAWVLVVAGHAVAGVMRIARGSALETDSTRGAPSPAFAPQTMPSPGGRGDVDRPASAVLRALPVETEITALAVAMDTLAGLLMAGATIGGLGAVSSTISLVAYMWLMVALDMLFAQPVWLIAGGVALVLAMCKWVLVDAIGGQATTAGAAYRPLLNPMMLSGGAISVSLVGAYFARRKRITDLLGSQAESWAVGLGMIVATAVVVLLSVGLAVEIDRAVDVAVAAGSVWPSEVLKHLSWTMLALAATAALAGLNLILEPRPTERFGYLRVLYGIAIAMAGKYMLLDTLLFRLLHSPAHVVPVGNTQVLAGVFALGAILLLIWMLRHKTGRETVRDAAQAAGRIGRAGGFLVILLLLWIGTMEIDRFCQVFAAGAPQMRLENVLLSIFWGLFAIGSVIAGFPTRLAALRYFGLGLFAVTLLKVVLVDLGDVGTGYRILSFMGVGLLLLGTSVIYGKFSPRLLQGTQSDRDENAQK